VILSNLTVDAVGGFSRLVVLDASYCELKQVDPSLFDCLPELETLHLEGGRLERLENLAALRRLRRLHLQENRLTTAVDLRGIDALESIDLSRNRIEMIPSQWLSGTRGLQIVNLSHNLITAIEPEAFHQVQLETIILPISGAFRNLKMGFSWVPFRCTFSKNVQNVAYFSH